MSDISTISGALTCSMEPSVLLEKSVRHHMLANGLSFLEGVNHLGLVDIDHEILESAHRKLISMGWNSRLTKSEGYGQDNNLETDRYNIRRETIEHRTLVDLYGLLRDKDLAIGG